MVIHFYDPNGSLLFTEDFSFSPKGLSVKYNSEIYTVKDVVYDATYGELQGNLVLSGSEEKIDDSIPHTEYVHPTKKQWEECKKAAGNSKLHAVKYIHDELHVGLKEAKDFIDKFF